MKKVYKRRVIRNIGTFLLASFLGAFIGLGSYFWFFKKQSYKSIKAAQQAYFTSYTGTSPTEGGQLPNFADVAEKVTPAVVQIIVTIDSQDDNRDRRFFFDDDGFFSPFGDDRERPKIQGSGSGVIVTPDGYIITNNHVVENAGTIKVVLTDNSTFEAEVVGRDPNTDLALLKIDAENLPIIRFGDSDKLRVGDWVLAVGNPFNLFSTVTAGIVSAKGRNIGLLNDGRRKFAIESFIQTDAAINRGNSGGALVNEKGELVGICSAIASNDGNYEGYGFAVPINLTKKIIEDIRKYGFVKRGFLGVSVSDISPQLKKSNDLSVASGAYIAKVLENGAAQKAGLKEGDVIVKIEDKPVKNVAQMLEFIGQKSPNDKLEITYVRDHKEKTASVTLKGNNEVNRTASTNDVINQLGVSVRKMSFKEKTRYEVSNGVVVTRIDKNKSFYRYSGFGVGSILIKINDTLVDNSQDVEQALQKRQDNFVVIVGQDVDGNLYRSAFPVR